MSAADDEIVNLTSAAEQKATDALAQAVTYTDTAQTVALGFSTFTDPAKVIAQKFTVPPYSPTIDVAGQFVTDYDQIWGDLEGWMKGLMSDYVNTFFPVLDPAIQETENAWLLSIINNGYLGIPVAVEQAMWDRANAKEVREAMRMEDEAVTQMSARGFSLPPGILANRLMTVQQDAANKASTVARDQAIEQTKISIEMTKFAIEETTKLRLGIAQAIAEWMRAWMSLPTAAMGMAKDKGQLDVELWNSSSEYIRAMVSNSTMYLDADIANQKSTIETTRTMVDNYLGAQKLRVDAAIAAAKEMGDVASAYASTLNTLAHVGSITNVSA